MRIAVVVLVCLLSIAALPQSLTSAADSNPCTAAISGPNDPDYARAERNLGGLTFNAEQWHLYDCIPQSAPVATDPENASGMSVNKAWAAFGTGGSDVIVTYIEGGVNWRINASTDIRRKAYLNCGELPAPEKADGSTMPGHSPGCLQPKKSYDLDGDGALTVDDYANDPRIAHPLLHPEAGGTSPGDVVASFQRRKGK